MELVHAIEQDRPESIRFFGIIVHIRIRSVTESRSKTIYFNIFRESGSSVGIATGYGMDGRGSIPGKG
jgi:hypothetical protein